MTKINLILMILVVISFIGCNVSGKNKVINNDSCSVLVDTNGLPIIYTTTFIDSSVTH